MRVFHWRALLATSLSLALTVMSGCQRSQEADVMVASPTRPVATPAPVEQASRTGRPGIRTERMGDRQTVSLYFPTGEPSGSVLLLEKSGPNEVTAGAPFEYTITVTNTTEDIGLRNVRVLDVLPGDVEVVSAQDARVSGEVLEWNVGTLMPGETQTTTVRGVAQGTGEVIICATAEYDIFLCLVMEAVQPQIRLTKSAPEQTLLCDPITYTIRVENTGTGTARGVRIEDTVPQGLTAQGQTSFDIGNLAPGESREVTITAEAQEVGNYTNVARVTAEEGIEGEARTETMVRRPVLEITKTAPNQAYTGSRFLYEITVTNTDYEFAVPAEQVVLRDTLPAGVNATEAREGGAISGNTVTWNLGTLQPGESRTVQLVARGIEIGRFENLAVAEAYCAAPVEARATTEFFGIPAVLLEVIDTEDPVQVGFDGEYVITVTNQGSTDATNVRVSARLEGMTYISATGPTQATVDADQRTFSFAAVPRIGPGEKATWTVTTRATETGDVRFFVEMLTDQIDRPVRETEATRIYDEEEFTRGGNIGGATQRPDVPVTTE